ncbi:MAG: hypothetical protein ABSH34_11545 [Verrucomicrobiota bacterium]|jgi:hypothetical protein
MNTSLFPSFVVSRLEAWNKQNSGKGKVGVAWHLPRAAARLRCAPAGLALGYYLAAPSGRRRSAESCFIGTRAGHKDLAVNVAKWKVALAFFEKDFLVAGGLDRAHDPGLTHAGNDQRSGAGTDRVLRKRNREHV